MLITRLTYNTQLQELIHEIEQTIWSKLNREDLRDGFKTYSFYPLLKDAFYKEIAKYLKGLGFQLTVKGTMKNMPRDVLFNDAITGNEELWVRYFIEYCVDQVYGRNVGYPETKDLNKLLKPCKEQTFRSFYHRIVYIRSENLIKAFKAMQFDCSPKDDGVIAYGYIDNQAGLSFKGLCCAHIGTNGQMQMSEMNTTASMTIRGDSIVDGSYLDMLETNADLFDFNDIIDHTQLYEPKESDLSTLRRLQFLDPTRHPMFPDDIKVALLKQGQKPEQVWVRSRSVINTSGLFTGTLLNEPHNDFGVHAGQVISFGFVNSDEFGPICIYADTKDCEEKA